VVHGRNGCRHEEPPAKGPAALSESGLPNRLSKTRKRLFGRITKDNYDDSILAESSIRFAGASSTSVRSITTPNTMIKAGASIACVATAATMIAASAVTSGSTRSDLDQLIKAQTNSVDRPMDISLRQIEYCLDQDRKNDQAALNAAFAGLDIKCPIDRGEI
jgi:hypothetical protein